MAERKKSLTEPVRLRWRDRFARRLARFFGDTEGQATVEFVIIFPAFLLLFGAFFSLSMMLLSAGQVMDVARDVARRVAVGEISDAEGELRAVSMLPPILNAVAVIEPDDTENVRLTISFNPDYNVLGSIGVFFSDGLSTFYVMRRENIAGAVASGG